MVPNGKLTRRALLGAAAAGLGATALEGAESFTDFQIACMTWPYRSFPFERAIEGIGRAGYRYVAWGPWHADSAGRQVQVIAPEASASTARRLAVRCRDAGLSPVMMFGVTVNGLGYIESPGSVDLYKRRIEQAEAARVHFILAFGSPKAPPAAQAGWVRNLKALGPVARSAGITIVIKQHGGVTADGRLCANILKEVNDEGIRMFYDAGNTRWHSNTDPLADLPSCAEYIRGFAIKDYRGQPKRAICGPGLGEIDHFKLLLPVARTPLAMPLACETLFEPFVPPPTTAEQIDTQALRARKFLEIMTRNIKAALVG